MNYLAHIFLSGTEEETLIGNFIGDYIKGKDYNNYPAEIKKGILLHRRIDAFTDRHKIISQSKSYFAPGYKKYAGIIIDIVYDHFLAVNWEKYCPQSLEEYKDEVFEILKRNYSIMPERVRFFVPSFIQNDWINVYSSIDGIILVLSRMAMRTTLPDESEFAREVLRKYYVQLQSEFLTYFPDIIRYVVNNHGISIHLRDNSILDK